MKKGQYLNIIQFFSNLILLVALKIPKFIPLTTVTTVDEVIEVNGGNGAHD